jgi:hypothetical protein
VCHSPHPRHVFVGLNHGLVCVRNGEIDENVRRPSPHVEKVAENGVGQSVAHGDSCVAHDCVAHGHRRKFVPPLRAERVTRVQEKLPSKRHEQHRDGCEEVGLASNPIPGAQQWVGRAVTVSEKSDESDESDGGDGGEKAGLNPVPEDELRV